MSRSAAENENGAGGTLLAEEVTDKQGGKHRRVGLESGSLVSQGYRGPWEELKGRKAD